MPARGGPASVIDLVMTSQDYIKVEYVKACFLSSTLAKFQQFQFWLLHLGAVCVTGLFGLG